MVAFPLVAGRPEQYGIVLRLRQPLSGVTSNAINTLFGSLKQIDAGLSDIG
jgi:hypothetical protein